MTFVSLNNRPFCANRSSIFQLSVFWIPSRSFSADTPDPEITRRPRQGLVPQSPCSSVCCRSLLRAAGRRSPPHRTALAPPAFWGDTFPSASVPVSVTQMLFCRPESHWENTFLTKTASSNLESPGYGNLVIYTLVILF